jgi:thymidylate synthase
MIELGIAYAMNKKIVLITKKWIHVKDTVKWVSDSIIEYENIEDIIKPMEKIYSEWK